MNKKYKERTFHDYRLVPDKDKRVSVYLYRNDVQAQQMATCCSVGIAKYIKQSLEIADKMGFGDISDMLIKQAALDSKREGEDERSTTNVG